ncbi:cell wall hydrolase [Aneurinibacillus migulanus]|uniref:cell wall hydrolase n=1 Tax=Aneurinibacillus migulanus TaxID=47500 RepID=UPI00209FA09F|nr:cell wall hydrolase [Aneurinibacillus migulanus]MCP1354794.1 cell wall hydrolase [Aneurinibacillus migulanus]
MKKQILLPMLLSAFILGSVAGPIHNRAEAASTLKYGMKNGAVKDLQVRLGTLGHLSAKATGYYGTLTEAAVRKFQREQGLSIDGVAGPNTMARLARLTVSKAELDKLARVIHGEARGESFEGQVAVGAVVMNRLKSDKFPKTIHDVIFQPGAFTAVSDGQYKLKPSKQAYRAARAAIRGQDPSGKSLYYFNPDIATSKWIWTRHQTKKIGKHIFAK